MSDLALVVAVAENGVIGHNGDLPWRLPADLRHFKRVTKGHTVLMGRRTYESIGRPLPKRRSIVLTRDPSFRAEGIETAPSLKQALKLAENSQVFVIGGSSVYAAALPVANVLYWTRVHSSVPGDVFFPPVDWQNWHLKDSQRHEADDKHAHAFTFERYTRSGYERNR